MKKYIIKPLAKVEENDLEGYAVEFTPDTITEAEHRKGLEYIGNHLNSKGVGAWNKGKKAFMVFENNKIKFARNKKIMYCLINAVTMCGLIFK